MNVRDLLDRLFPAREGSGGAEAAPWVVVGLGNPGPEYKNTRHNVGWWCIDELVRRASATLDRKNRHARLAQVQIEGQDAVLAMPKTFVNKSGDAVKYLLDRFRSDPERLIVVYDDINLDPGKIRIRRQGSAGGHNGMKSIIASIGTDEFPRVRIGVGRPPSRSEQIGHVLGAFPPDEREAVNTAVQNAADAVGAIIAHGTEEAMNRFN
ncbi:MAG: aminoacyl-tRNA hydrolase [Dehalococcoidia bacterium]